MRVSNEATAMRIRRKLSVSVLMGVMGTSLVSCGSNPHVETEEQRFEIKSQCGNEPSYTINGITYKTLPSAKGYKKDGMASWYGAAYQGSQTASCETFDMFAYTAAHRTLPLPSYVKVTNKKNGKSVIVKVNDRGPFDSSNDIELSFAAANAIGMVRSKVAPVHIEAITPDQFNHRMTTKTNISSKPSISYQQPKTYAKAHDQQSKAFYVVVGRYTNNNDAIDMFVRLSSIGISKAEMATAFGTNRELYLVRVGPLYSQDHIDNIKDRLTQDGLTNFKVVSE